MTALSARAASRPGDPVGGLAVLAIPMSHRTEPAHQIAKVVGEVDVVAILEPLPREVAVLAVADLFRQIQPERVRTKPVGGPSGSRTVPSDLLIFWPFQWTHP